MTDSDPCPPRHARPGLRALVTLGVGLCPGAPGTYASLLVAALAASWLCLGGAPLAGPWYLLACLLVAGLAVASCHRAVRLHLLGPEPDPGAIVVDEAVGMLVALYGCAEPGWSLLLVFGAFRIFDIFKPWPVGWSQRLPGGWGIVADDILAGLYALAVVKVATYWAPGWA
ncbi:phosphatidylglycerophosphatase A [Desulfarculales bacterium]